MNTSYFNTFETPAGAFSVAVDTSGAVVATAFGGVTELKRRFKTTGMSRDDQKTAKAKKQVLAYFRNPAVPFSLRLSPQGTSFQKKVWALLEKIPAGQTRSYGELARTLKSGARAVGRANATNPVCLIVPCHRVIGSDGSLTGFAFGETIKRQLLEREGAPLSSGA